MKYKIKWAEFPGKLYRWFSTRLTFEDGSRAYIEFSTNGDKPVRHIVFTNNKKRFKIHLTADDLELLGGALLEASKKTREKK